MRGHDGAGEPHLLTGRDVAIWTVGFLLAAVLLVALGFTSDDPDSALYAALSARLAALPMSQWIAPEWWGQWDSEGWFREHPAGVFLLPTALAAVGVPGVQAAYVVGIGAALASLLLSAHLVRGITSRKDARLVLLLLQLMPLASIFRIRANHEYPLFVCLLIALIGADAVRRSWTWAWVTPVALVSALMIKGVFVLLPLVALGIWIPTNPRRESGSPWRAVAAVAMGAVAMAIVALAYDAAYQRATGEFFWRPYWERQLAPLTIATPVEGGSVIVEHAWFYLVRVAWHPAPWSGVLLAAAWMRRRDLARGWHSWTVGERRGATFGLVSAALMIGMLIPASRFAERYIFVANYFIATVGIVVAARSWPGLAATCARWDQRVPGLPALLWFGLIVVRLVLGPYLPRISG